MLIVIPAEDHLSTFFGLTALAFECDLPYIIDNGLGYEWCGNE